MNDLPEPHAKSRGRLTETPWRLLALRFVIYTAVIVCVCYAGLLVDSRTKGFAYLCADKARDVIGMPVQVGKSRLDAALQLTLNDLGTTNDVTRNGRVNADEVRVEWGIVTGVTLIEVQGLRCEALYRADKGWRPALFSALGNSPVFGQLSHLAPPEARNGMADDADELNPDAEAPPVAVQIDKSSGRPDFTLRLKGVDIRFRTPENETLARLDGATFLYEPARARADKSEHVLLEGWFEWKARRRPRQEIRVEVLKSATETRIIQLHVDADLIESIEQSLRSLLP